MKGQDGQNNSGSTLPEGIAQKTLYPSILSGKTHRRIRAKVKKSPERGIWKDTFCAPVSLHTPHNPYPWTGQLSNQKNFILTYMGHKSFDELQMKKNYQARHSAST